MSDFVYPFNFVPPAKQSLCRRSGYQPLNRYGNKTGRIEFTLTSLSPLFIPDPEQVTFYHVKDDEKCNPQYHRVADFFNVKERLAIPGTALKGMFRAVAEALSSSSFGVFTPSKERFKFRKVTDLSRAVGDLSKRKWGRWQTDGTITPLSAAKLSRDEFDKATGWTTDALRIAGYDQLRQKQTTLQAELWQLHTGSPHVRTFSGPYTGTVFANAMSTVQNGELGPRPNNDRKSQVTTGSVHYNGPDLTMLRHRLGLPENVVWPVKVQFRTIPNVPRQGGIREERVCWVNAGGAPWEADRGTMGVILWPRRGWEDMTDTERRQSHYVTVLYQQGNALTVTPSAKQDYRDANAGELPQPGDIVRYYAQNSPSGWEVVEFGPVAMFKTPERATVQAIAGKTEQILPCTKNTALCPASRLFGWTPDSGQGESDSGSPVAGRVRVGVAWSDRRLSDTRLVPLRILSSPKPEYYPFYLRPEDDQVSFSRSAYYATRTGLWWHRAGKLRGRKFYLHHRGAMTSAPAVSLEYIQMTPAQVSKEVSDRHLSGEQVPREEMCSHQNISAAVLPAGAVFKSYLEFDSLADYELGLLLWAVSLADSPLEGCPERAHKLGLGRPLGLGSVRVKIDRIVTWDPVGSWRAAEDPGEQEIDTAEAARLVKVFKTWLVTGQEQEKPDDKSVARFHNQEFYGELCNVLSLNLAGDAPVQYHPQDVQPYEGYKYFMEQRKKRRHGTEKTLRTPQELRDGQRQTGQ